MTEVDPASLLSSFHDLPIAVAVCRADGTILICSGTFESLTGLATGGQFGSSNGIAAKDLKIGERSFLVWSTSCGDHTIVGLLDNTDLLKAEDKLWEFQMRLSKVYSELNVRNKQLSEALEQVRKREKELEGMNEVLEKKVAESMKDLERTGRLKRYFSPDIVNSIISEDALGLGTHKRLITIFFAELSNFEEMTGEMESEEVIEILNEYHQEMTALIFIHGGTIDKFIASRIIGFFGDPIPMEDHAQRAVRMALAMREKVQGLREHWFVGTARVELRVGIHAGYATVGNVGCANRMDYTAIGKNVTLAAQLLQEAQPGQILISNRTYDMVKGDFDFDPLKISVKTGSRPITVYNILGSKAGGEGALTIVQSAGAITEILPGQRFGPYEVQEKLGEGGMGIVFRGFDASLERHVAIKVLHPSFSRDEKFLARFKREAKTLASLNSPYIAQIYFISESPPFFAMEFIDGPSLGKLIEEKERIPFRRGCEILLQVIEALELAAEKEVIHRDIKPDNIMLTSRNVVKVTDFGLVKFRSGDSTMTTQGLILGTPHYMSPEQARSEDLDFRADMYSLGATLFHMLVGHPPFQGESALDVLRDHIDKPLPQLSTLPPDISAGIYKIIQRMMAKNRNERFPSYAAVREALSNC